MKSEWLSNWNGHKAWAAAIVLNEIGEGVEVKHASKKEIEAAEAAGVERRPCRYPSGEFMLASKGGAIAKIIEIPAWPMPSFAVFIGGKKLAEISGEVGKLEAAIKKVKLPEAEKGPKKPAEVVVLRARVKALEAELAGLRMAA